MRHWSRHAPPPTKLNSWGADAASALVTCENDARDTFPAAQKANSVKVREGGLDSDQHPFFLLPPIRNTQGAKSSPRGTQKPAGSCRRTRECCAEPSPTPWTGRPDTRAQARPPQPPETAPRHRHAHHWTRKTRHNRAHGRPANTSTSTSPPSKRSNLGLSWRARGCTEGDRRGLATDGCVNMISTSEAERTVEVHCEKTDEGLCVQRCL